eukprot:CAMPEP_0179435984 /NCGR_PEP_ID=MMETSP0799-20121207/20004_1 /TAXON_ID=46947 /ORGANISM="Geminigera cryophila, Strain CCMP2564" /LENGTH=661 /DNA_ID=CAMNT_0021215721 /DNA_START=50 /DNA_END=2031 /DNA_ORIENTATION=+
MEMHSRWAPPPDNFSPGPTSAMHREATVPGMHQFVDNDMAAFRGRKSATSAMHSDGNLKAENMQSLFAGAESTVERSSVSSRRGFGRPAPPKFATSEGPVQDEEALAMFKRIDLNMDGSITHAELMRALLFTPEIARRLECSGDPVHKNLVRKVVKREISLPEYDTFSVYEWLNFCQSATEREGKAEKFVEAYELEENFDFRALEQAARLARMHQDRIGDASPLQQASSIMDRSASMQARATHALSRNAERLSSPSSSGFGQVHRPSSNALSATSPRSISASRAFPSSSGPGPHMQHTPKSQSVVSAADSVYDEPNGGYEEVWDATKGLIHSNHELTRQLQACIHKAEEDEHRIKECEANAQRFVEEKEIMTSKFQLEMKIAADLLEKEYSEQAESQRRRREAELAGFSAEADRKLKNEKRKFAEELGIISDEAAAAIAGLEGELRQTKAQRDKLLQTERDLTQSYADLDTEKGGLEQDVTNRDGIIGGLEYEKNELTEDLSGLTQRHALTENELSDVTRAHAAHAATIKQAQDELKQLVQQLARARAETGELRGEKQMLEEIVEEHQEAHQRKDATVREALKLGRKALAERNELARRLRETHHEIEVQTAMAVADGGHLHVEQLEAVKNIMGPHPADPDASTPADSVIGDDDDVSSLQQA